MIGVCFVNRVSLALADIHSERLPAVRLVRVVGLAVMLDEIGNERVRAGGVVWRIGQRQNVLVRADGESLDLAEFGVLQLLAQDAEEMLPPFLVIREGHA